MLFKTLLVISCVLGLQAQGQFGQNTMGQNMFNRQGAAQGNAAGAGNAAVRGNGQASSINQANHQATKDMTQASGLSANTAEGDSPTVSGAAQATGQVDNAEQGASNFGQQSFGQGFNNNGGGFNGGGERFEGHHRHHHDRFNNNNGFGGGVGFVPNAGDGFDNGAGFDNGGDDGVAVVPVVPVGGGGGFDGGNFNGGGFNGGGQSADQSFRNRQVNKQSQGAGQAAAAGSAGAQGPGSATSINQANHQATKDMTAANGMSANTAQGFGANANGATQAGGGLQSAFSGQNQFGHNHMRESF